MTIINTTFIVDAATAAEVLRWIRSTYVNSARRTGYTSHEHLLTRLIDTPDPATEGYAVHLTFPDMDSACDWDNKYGSRLRAIAQERWGEKALAFATFLEVMQ